MQTVKPKLDAGDCIAVGYQLRALAKQSPNLDTAALLERVGQALIDEVVVAVESQCIVIPLHQTPPVITESIGCVIRAHNLRFLDADGHALKPDRVSMLLDEIGRNAAMALTSIDKGLER